MNSKPSPPLAARVIIIITVAVFAIFGVSTYTFRGPPKSDAPPRAIINSSKCNPAAEAVGPSICKTDVEKVKLPGQTKEFALSPTMWVRLAKSGSPEDSTHRAVFLVAVLVPFLLAPLAFCPISLTIKTIKRLFSTNGSGPFLNPRRHKVSWLIATVTPVILIGWLLQWEWLAQCGAWGMFALAIIVGLTWWHKAEWLAGILLAHSVALVINLLMVYGIRPTAYFILDYPELKRLKAEDDLFRNLDNWIGDCLFRGDRLYLLSLLCLGLLVICSLRLTWQEETSYFSQLLR